MDGRHRGRRAAGRQAEERGMGMGLHMIGHGLARAWKKAFRALVFESPRRLQAAGGSSSESTRPIS